jgi:hypothetical protein
MLTHFYYKPELTLAQAVLKMGGAQPGRLANRVDFVSLHNIAKYIIYLNEAADAMIFTLDGMRACHNVRNSQNLLGKALAPATDEGLRYRKGLFQSTQLRLKSIEKRMANIINLVRFISFFTQQIPS